MTIKTKLIANALVTATLVGAISLSSYFSIRFLQERLSFLTEKSTPFQMRTMELQRELQGSIAALVKVNAARSIAEYTSLRNETEQSLDAIANTQKALKEMGSDAPGVADELGSIARELFTATEGRIASTSAAAAANATVVQSMRESSARLADLEVSIRNLQRSYAKAFTTALENTGACAERLEKIEELRNLVRELQLVALNVQNAQSGTTVLIAKGKLKSVAVRIDRNEYYKTNTAISGIVSGFVTALTEYIRLQGAAFVQKDAAAKNRAAEFGKDLPYKLGDLFQTLDQETMLVRDELTLANSRQGALFAQSGSANSILVTNSELVALGLMVTGETNRLFTVDSKAELDKRDTEIRSLFTKINERVKSLENALTSLNSKAELKTLRAAVTSLATVHSEIYSATGIVAALKHKITVIEQADRSAERLREIVLAQTTKGNKSVADAQTEQERSIASVTSMVRRSLAQISGIGSLAVAIGIFFGFWIYRSVLLPLRVVLRAVDRQQKLAKEKANLAEAVAGGDLTREVHISEAMILDPSQVKHDEMGMVLKSVAGMSEAQATLDRAFSDMTASLLCSRTEDDRRDRLKSGLNELNKILRNEQDTAMLASTVVAFIASFVGAGVGIIYAYDEAARAVQTLATYAIPPSKGSGGTFRYGEGLVGQVARERKTIILDTVPQGYLPITSALGEADPFHIVIMPMMYNDVLAGILELGSFRSFNDDDIEFLQQAVEGVAIAISVNHSHQQVNHLLEQTQQQTEELRTQQEELQQTNEELLERARLLAEHRRMAPGAV